MHYDKTKILKRKLDITKSEMSKTQTDEIGQVKAEVIVHCDHIIGEIKSDDGCELIRTSDIKSVADKNRCDKFMEKFNFCADCGKAADVEKEMIQ